MAHRSAVVPPGVVRSSARAAHRGRRGPGSGEPERIWRKASAVPPDLPIEPRSDRSSHLDLGGDRLDGVPDRALAETLWAGICELDGCAALWAGTLSAALHQRRANRLGSPRGIRRPRVRLLSARPFLRSGAAPRYVDLQLDRRISPSGGARARIARHDRVGGDPYGLLPGRGRTPHVLRPCDRRDRGARDHARPAGVSRSFARRARARGDPGACAGGGVLTSRVTHGSYRSGRRKGAQAIATRSAKASVRDTAPSVSRPIAP